MLPVSRSTLARLYPAVSRGRYEPPSRWVGCLDRCGTSWQYKIVDPNAEVWTESYWGSDLGAAIFIQNSAAADWAMLIVGIVVTVVFALIVFSSNKFYDKHLKQI